MRFERNGSDTDLKMVNDKDRPLPDGSTLRAGVVGYAWKAPNGYWQATTAENSGRQLVRNGNYRSGKGYTGADEAGAAIIDFVTQGAGI